MTVLPIPSVASRLNAFAAAAVLTLALLAGIDNLATRQSIAPPIAKAASMQAA